MVGVLEVAGYTIVGGALGQVAVELYGRARQRAEEARRARQEVQLFEKRALFLLEHERAERDRTDRGNYPCKLVLVLAPVADVFVTVSYAVLSAAPNAACQVPALLTS